MRKDGPCPKSHLPWDPATHSAAQHRGHPGSRGPACKTQQLCSFGSRTTDSLLKVTVCPPEATWDLAPEQPSVTRSSPGPAAANERPPTAGPGVTGKLPAPVPAPGYTRGARARPEQDRAKAS